MLDKLIQFCILSAIYGKNKKKLDDNNVIERECFELDVCSLIVTFKTFICYQIRILLDRFIVLYQNPEKFPECFSHSVKQNPTIQDVQK